ncbi:MAG: hypothetical protein QOD57_2502, partial [Actinomycetota bacterium]|nr:hypothetical protein [Actinomycetota bacterium]
FGIVAGILDCHCVVDGMEDVVIGHAMPASGRMHLHIRIVYYEKASGPGHRRKPRSAGLSAFLWIAAMSEMSGCRRGSPPEHVTDAEYPGGQ